MTKSESINYIVSSQNGYLDDLQNIIGNDNLTALLLTGFLKRGKEISNKDSWKATNLAQQFSSSINTKVSFVDKVRYFINDRI